jgi:PHD/YefM family antitoxin component YafN of YafNO toxin-antitoxin module
MSSMNTEQDKGIARVYVSRSEFEERMRLLDERAQRNTDTLKEIRDELRRQRETFDVWAFEQRKSKR